MNPYWSLEDVAEIVTQFWVLHGAGPSVRELKKELGYSSTSSVQRILNECVNHKLLERGANNQSRSMRPPGGMVPRRLYNEALARIEELARANDAANPTESALQA